VLLERKAKEGAKMIIFFYIIYTLDKGRWKLGQKEFSLGRFQCLKERKMMTQSLSLF
jgi:hypothetical protein